MLTKEKYNLLNAIAKGFSEQIKNIPAHEACLGTGIAGVIIDELPANHKLFNMPIPETVSMLTEMVADYSLKILRIMKQEK